MMRQLLLPVLTLLLLLFSTLKPAHAQTQEILGGNLLNGAINGSLLGAAAMGLQNSDDFAPLRIGLGSGILYGVGMAAWDTTQRPENGDLVIPGTFNQGRNSSIIVLLDTIYGAAGGALIGMAGMLIADQPISEGLQYGSSSGAWAGFAFGLVDRFILAERNRAVASIFNRNAIIELPRIAGWKAEMGKPDWVSRIHLSEQSLTRQIEPSWTFLALNWKL
ncbi:MAG: hypothetical protein WD115_01765 [Balneolaceae bacterium]